LEASHDADVFVARAILKQDGFDPATEHGERGAELVGEVDGEALFAAKRTLRDAGTKD
jgi:hypothetical protein